jgi:ubiquinone/menaquinone biosynthesis C-methylase UbiE
MQAPQVASQELEARKLRLLCPSCRCVEVPFEDLGRACAGCSFRFVRNGAVIRALPREREQYYTAFAEQYLAIRKAEGRGSENPSYYLALPYQDLSGRLQAQWAMRGKSYQYFERSVLPQIEAQRHGGLDVLDLGAGTGWLSYRLARRGHRPAAIDLLDDPLDGLGAAKHFFTALGNEFPVFQAEFDNLPFVDRQFDLAIFNSSLHYSADYHRSLREARRCLRPAGRVVILDSPVYKRTEEGEKMREERHQQFENRYGFRSDHIPSIEYLDEPVIAGLSRELAVQWTIHRPWYGWRWHTRPLRAWLGNRRAPSRFWILEGKWGAP